MLCYKWPVWNRLSAVATVQLFRRKKIVCYLKVLYNTFQYNFMNTIIIYTVIAEFILIEHKLNKE